MMAQQQLAGAMRCRERILVAGRVVVLGQAPYRRQALVERGYVRRRIGVAVPATIGPLGAKQDVNELSHPRVLSHAQPAADRERIAFHRGVTPLAARDDPWFLLPRRGDPSEHVLGIGVCGAFVPMDAKLDQ